MLISVQLLMFNKQGTSYQTRQKPFAPSSCIHKNTSSLRKKVKKNEIYGKNFKKFLPDFSVLEKLAIRIKVPQDHNLTGSYAFEGKMSDAPEQGATLSRKKNRNATFLTKTAGLKNIFFLFFRFFLMILPRMSPQVKFFFMPKWKTSKINRMYNFFFSIFVLVFTTGIIRARPRFFYNQSSES